MKRMLTIALIALAIGSLVATGIHAHCQVPCGIYDDVARIGAMMEDVTTIEKAITNIESLAGKTDALSVNQCTRWINTKESHASHIITTIAEYFLTQKVKPVAADADGYGAYTTTLAEHHRVMRAAMAAKQQVDPATVTELRAALSALSARYDVPHDH